MWDRAERELHAELWGGGLISVIVLVHQGECTRCGGIALLGLAMHCLVASAMVC